MDQPLTKQCRSCLKVKVVPDDFHVAKGNKDGRSNECKECRAAYLQKWHAKNRTRTTTRTQELRKEDPARFRSYWLKYKYGINSEIYDAMFTAQQGRCAICGKEETRKTQFKGVRTVHPLAVDHNHVTGEIRGLLCHKCNIVIAFIDEDTSMLPRIEAYLS